MTENASETSKNRERPLSPHLQVYRLPYNAKMSISGRLVGIGLAMVLIILLGWFNAVVWKPEFYDQTMTLLTHDLAKYGFIALSFLIFFYLGNGIRHVLWDIGIGVNEKAGILSGNIVLVVSFLLTLGIWEITCGCWGAMLSGGEVEILEGAQNAE